MEGERKMRRWGKREQGERKIRRRMRDYYRWKEWGRKEEKKKKIIERTRHEQSFVD